MSQSASTNDLRELRGYLSPHRRQDTPVCATCRQPRDPDGSYRGSYCSRECWLIHKGEKALRRIASDHRWCATCFRQIKTTAAPPEGHELLVEPPQHAGRDETALKRDCLVGYKYPTEHTTWVVNDHAGDDVNPVLHRQWGCVCGNVDPGANTRAAVIGRTDFATTATSLWYCLEELSDRDVLGGDASWSRFEASIRAHERWELVAGRTLYEA